MLEGWVTAPGYPEIAELLLSSAAATSRSRTFAGPSAGLAVRSQMASLISGAPKALLPAVPEARTAAATPTSLGPAPWTVSGWWVSAVGVTRV